MKILLKPKIIQIIVLLCFSTMLFGCAHPGCLSDAENLAADRSVSYKYFKRIEKIIKKKVNANLVVDFTGEVAIEFTVDQNGKISDIEIVNDSDILEEDLLIVRSTVQGIKRVPRFPRVLRHYSELSFSITLSSEVEREKFELQNKEPEFEFLFEEQIN